MSNVVALLYDASLDLSGERWTAALTALGDVAGARAAVVLAMQRDKYDYNHAIMIGTGQGDAEVYRAHYAQLDPCLEPRMATSPVGTVHVTDHLIRDHDLQKTEFYADWIAPRGWHSGIGTVLLREPSARALLVLARERRAGPFPAECLTQLQRTMPHLQHAVHVASRMAVRAPGVDIVSQAVRNMSDAVLVTDVRGHLVSTNARADQHLARGDAICTQRVRGSARATLEAKVPADAVALHAMIGAVCKQVAACDLRRSNAPTNARQSGGAVVLRRLHAKPLMALVTPLRMEMPPTHVLFSELVTTRCEPRALIIIIDPESAPEQRDQSAVLHGYLRTAFTLTEAEASVALALADGGGLSAVADVRGVSLATVRTQAQRVYDKTGLRSQAALATFVARLQAGMVRAGGGG